MDKNNINLDLIDLFKFKPTNTWYSWIPTNFNSLEFDFIGRDSSKTIFLDKDIEQNKIYYVDFKPQLSDKMGLHIHEIFLNSPGQMLPISYVELKFEDNKYIGDVFVVFLEKKQYQEIINIHREILKKRKIDAENSFSNKDIKYEHKENVEAYLSYYSKCINEDEFQERLKNANLASLLLRGHFEVERNGLFTINDLCLQALSVSEDNKIIVSDIEYPLSIQVEKSLKREIKDERFDISVQALYTIVKRLFHKDNHHDAKIDDILFVQKDKYNALETMHTLGKRLKNIEMQIRLKKVDNINNIASFAEGLVSYSKTFAYENITNKEEQCKQINIHDNILSSILATAKRASKYVACSQSFKNAAILAIGWMISLSILLTGVLKLNIDNNLTGEYSAQSTIQELTTITILEVSSNSIPKKGIYAFVEIIHNNVDNVMLIIVFVFIIIFIVPLIFKCSLRYIKNAVGHDRYHIIRNQLNLRIQYMLLLIMGMYILYELYEYIPILFESESKISLWIKNIIQFIKS